MTLTDLICPGHNCRFTQGFSKEQFQCLLGGEVVFLVDGQLVDRPPEKTSQQRDVAVPSTQSENRPVLVGRDILDTILGRGPEKPTDANKTRFIPNPEWTCPTCKQSINNSPKGCKNPRHVDHYSDKLTKDRMRRNTRG